MAMKKKGVEQFINRDQDEAFVVSMRLGGGLQE